MKKVAAWASAALLATALAMPAMAADPDYDYGMAAAASGLYVQVDLGASLLRWDGPRDDEAFTIGGGIGYRFNDVLRADVRYTYAGKYSIGGGTDLTASTLMGNIFFDLPVRDLPFRPYIGAGLGYGWANYSPGSDDDGLAAAFMAGLNWQLPGSLTLDTGYRFRDIFVSGPNVTDHQFIVGLRYRF